MANSPREFQDRSTQLQSTPSFLTSPTSCVNSNISSIVTSSDGTGIYHHHHHHSNPSTPRTSTGQTITRSEPTNNPYPTTFVQADTNSFKQVVQMLTGSTITTTTKHPSSQSTPDPNPSSSHPPRNHHNHHHQIPPIKPVSKPKPSRLLERRNSQKSLRLTPLIPSTSTPNHHHHHHLSPRHYPPPPELLSPSILDFPSLILSPVTPLIHDPFNRSSSSSSSSSYPGLTRCAPQTSLTADRLAEEKAIAEKGFYLHRSPATTPRGSSEPPPRLLPLFPLTSPKVSGCSSDD